MQTYPSYKAFAVHTSIAFRIGAICADFLVLSQRRLEPVAVEPLACCCVLQPQGIPFLEGGAGCAWQVLHARAWPAKFMTNMAAWLSRAKMKSLPLTFGPCTTQ